MKKDKLEKEAIKIDELIAAGRMTEEDLSSLVEQGLAQETVDYWKNRKRSSKSFLQKVCDFLIR